MCKKRITCYIYWVADDCHLKNVSQDHEYKNEQQQNINAVHFFFTEVKVAPEIVSGHSLKFLLNILEIFGKFDLLKPSTRAK